MAYSALAVKLVYRTVTIRRLEPTDSMTGMTALVRAAYKRLGDMGFRFKGTWQEEEDTRERCAEGHCLVAVSDGRIVGTVTASNPDSSNDPEWYRRTDVWVVGQFAVLPELQSDGIGSRLLAEAEKHAFENGASEVAIDTAEGAAHLIEYYAKRGYRQVGSVDWDGTNYVSVIMSKRLRPLLETVRLVLRELCTPDIAVFKSHWADERFQATYPPGRMTPEFCEELFTKEIASLYVFPRTNFHWAICLDGSVIGGVRLTIERSGSGTLGYGLGAEHWDRGYATEAVREVVRYAFEELHLHRVQAWVFANNAASQRVLEKVGFTYEGALREKVAWGDARVDDNIYGLLKSEWTR